MESLQAVIKDKTEDYDSLIAANQQAQKDVIERNDEIDKLAGRIRELEQALLNSADSSRSVSQLEQEVHRTKLRERELLQVSGPTKALIKPLEKATRLSLQPLLSKKKKNHHHTVDEGI